MRALLSQALRSRFASDAASSMAIKVASLVLGLALNMLLARLLNPSGMGQYALAFTVMTLFTMPIQSGMAALMVREVAAYDERSQPGLLHGILRFANGAVILLLMLATVFALLLAYWGPWEALRPPMIIWLLIMAPLYVLGALRGATLQGLGHVLLGQFPDRIIRPAVFVLLLAGIWFSGTELAPAAAMALHAAAALVAFVVGMVWLLRRLPASVRHAAPEYAVPAWRAAILPFTLLAGLQVLNGSVDVLMLGALRPSSEVGFFRTAEQFANLMGFAQLAISSVLTPRLSRAFVSGRYQEAQSLSVWSARIMFATAAPLALLYFLAGDRVLGIAFGPEYAAGWGVLSALAVGALAGAICGPVGNVLNMAGHERQVARILAEGLVLNVALNYPLITWFGATGAATATSVSIIYCGLRMLFKAKSLCGIHCNAFAPATRITPHG